MVKQVIETSRAWLLDFGRGMKAAVGAHEMSHVILSPELYEVPCSPAFCDEVLVWQDYILPVLDMNIFLRKQKMMRTHSGVVGIAIYQEDRSKPLTYAGLHLAETPVNIFVSDEQACELPAQKKEWGIITISCFTYKNDAIPIIDLAILFSGKV
jgi:chemotaxis signal transduction protein